MACHVSPPELSSPLSSVPSSAASDSGLSELSNSPTPPPEISAAFAARRSYPSPSSSRRSSAKASPVPENMASPPSSGADDSRPRKKRKTADPKERTTERLHLSDGIVPDGEHAVLGRLKKMLYNKRKIVVIAGAGISVSAGIPDFRSSSGLFKSLRKEHKLKSSGKDLFDASVYQDDTSTSSFHTMVRTLSQETQNAQPTPFHHLLATLADEGRLMRLYTQNVDGIDTSLPPLQTQVPLPKKGPWPKTVQLHGGLKHMVCSKCHTLSDLDAELFDGPAPPPCPSCLETDSVRQVAEKRSHGIGRLRPRIVLYNEHNPDDEAIGSCATTDIRLRPDAVIVAGTTLKVPGVRRIVREMCATVRNRRDGLTVWINNDPEPVGKDLANSWDIVVEGPCDEVAHHANMRKWNETVPSKEVTAEELAQIHEKRTVEVQVRVPGTPKKPNVIQEKGQLTPRPSPRIAAQTSSNDHLNGQSTPTKGRKRNSDGVQINLYGTVPSKLPTKKRQTQAKKATGAKPAGKKGTKEAAPSNQITNTFKASKGSKVTKNAASSKSDKFVHSKYNNIEGLSMAPIPSPKQLDNIHVPKRDLMPSTPTRKRTRLTKLKPEFAALEPLSPSDSRTNSPLRPPVEGFTPGNSPTKDRTPSEQIKEEELYRLGSASDSRPSSSGSSRNPNGMDHLLHPH